MILSVSRRTDVPAFYSQWFFNRLKQGYVLVRNPMNPRQVSRIPLNPDIIDCIVFWTKNPRPMMDKPDQLKNYNYYFLFTITAYGPGLEKHLPAKNEIIDTFIELSRRIGKDRVVWRYDPVLLAAGIDQQYHCDRFDYIAERLKGYTGRCIFSFLDMYKKCQRNLRGFDIKSLTIEDMRQLANMLAGIAGKHGIPLVTCAEEIDLSTTGITHGKCIDDELISKICGYPLEVKKDKHQRKTCRCVESIDIGAYNTCPHICLYCYANADAATVKQNHDLHSPDSPFLFGQLRGDERITERRVSLLKKN